MKKLSVIVPHFLGWRWIASCVWHFKTYSPSIDWELIVCDNSPGHPSIRALSDTPLGENVKIVQGDPNLPSHGQGYWKCYEQATGDWIFTAENDSFPTRHGWFEIYVKESVNYQLIGPRMPMSAGSYIHPAGACISRAAIEQAREWQKAHTDWWFCPGAAVKMGLSDRPYHVVSHEEMLRARGFIDDPETANWRRAEVWQEMRSFDEDTFEGYGKRRGITRWEPIPCKFSYLKIGYEAGQWLSYFCSSHGIPVKEADLHIEWMNGRRGRQAAYSTIYGGFTHIWAGSSSLVAGLEQEVRDFKCAQMNHYFNQLPGDIKAHIEKLEAENP